MLVLAVIVAVMAVVTPAIYGPLENYRLRKAGELVRARWAKARSEAMRTGQTYMFRFQPGQSAFQIQPWVTEQDLVESSYVGADLSAGTGGNVLPVGPLNSGNAAVDPFSAAGPTPSAVNEELPDGTLFVGFDSVLSIRDAAVSEQLQSTGVTQDGWSAPILFYPDGTCSTARLVLGNQRGYFLVLRLRGLSGVTEVSDLLSADELARE